MTKNRKDLKLLVSSLCVLLSLGLVSCGNKTRIKGQQSFGSIAVGFSDVFEGVLKNNCIECHSSYNDYTLSAAQADKMLETVLSGRMPKGRPALETREVAILRSWVQAGAPEEAGGEAMENEGLKPTFDSLLVNFFAPKCLSCHSGNPNAPGPVNINFSSYEELLKSAEDYDRRNQASGFRLIGSGDPEESDLLFILTDTGFGGQPMPPASLPGDPSYVNPGFATDEEIDVLTQWISSGAPKN